MSGSRFVCLLFSCLLTWGAVSAAEPATATTLRGLSTACANALIRANLHAIAVPDFADSTTRAWGGEMGPAGRYLARQFAPLLAEAGLQRFSVRNAGQLAGTIPGAPRTIDELTNPATLRAAYPGQDGVALGTLTRDGLSLQLRVDLLRVRDRQNVGTQRAVVPLDADLLSLLGANLQVNTGAELYKVTADAVLSTARSAAERINPLLDPACPYRLEVLVGETVKTLYRQQNNLYIPATAGERYAVRLTNNTGSRVGITLFIDGLNVVRQQPGIPSQSPFIIVKPNSSVLIPGWLLDNGQNKAFLFIASALSVAGSKGLIRQIGLITATCYPEVPVTERRIWATPPPEGSDERKRGLLGTGEGEDTSVTLHRVDDCATSRFPVVILTLRYDDAATVEKYEKAQP